MVNVIKGLSMNGVLKNIQKRDTKKEEKKKKTDP